MSDLIPTNITVPAHIAARMASAKQNALATNLGGGLGLGDFGPRISIKGSRFRIVKDGAETVLEQTNIDVVIVGANPKLSKQWYATKYDPNNEPTAADCYSHDGIAPVPEAESPQSDLCATCPHNAWGSRIGDAGQKLKACSDQKRLAVIAADDPDGDIYLLTVTPAALKGLNEYHKTLTLRGFSPGVVRTRVSFDTDASFPKLKFAFAGFLDDDVIDKVDKIVGTDPVLMVTGEKAQSGSAVPPPAAPAPSKPMLVKAPAAEPAAPPAPHEEPTPEAAAPSAPVIKGFGGGKPAATAAVAEKPAAKPKPVEPKVASSDDMAKEIEALLNGMTDDDGTD